MQQKPTVLMKVINQWNRMPSSIFNEWMRKEWEKLLQEEKQQIILAHGNGVEHEGTGEIDSEIYYTDTYKDHE